MTTTDRRIFFASDHHLFHDGILKFEDDFGNRLRPFDNLEHMHDCLLTRHNERVRDHDIVYFMGDVTWKTGPEFVELMSKFRGRKRLLPGNHDDIKKIVATHVFQKISIWRVFNEQGLIPFTASHVPLDEESVKGQFNLHGHTHARSKKHWRYINNCVEQTDWAPRSMDEVQAIMRERLGAQCA